MTSIEWVKNADGTQGQTWNPIVGCSIVSPGCTHCYAMAMAARIEAMGNQPRYAGTTRKVNGNAVWTGKLAQAPDSVLLAPLRRKKPTTYFVNSMGDLFHRDIRNAWRDPVFAVMAITPQHTYQILTKRAEEMHDYMNTSTLQDDIAKDAARIDPKARFPDEWPLPNVWLGISAERQQEADERIPLLLQTPAAVRFISAEPLLGPLRLDMIAAPKLAPDDDSEGWKFNCLDTGDHYWLMGDDPLGPGERCIDSGDGPYREHAIDWVIVGGESGPGARPMHPDWARSLRDQCAAADVPFFFKQWGEYALGALNKNWTTVANNPQLTIDNPAFDMAQITRVGKKAAGRLLDGITHDAMPQVHR